MLMIVAIGVVAGFALGLRFRVLILVPSIGLALAIIAIAGIGHSTGWIALAMVIAAASIQMGYLGGVVAMHLVAAAKPALSRSPLTQSLDRVRGVVSR